MWIRKATLEPLREGLNVCLDAGGEVSVGGGRCSSWNNLDWWSAFMSERSQTRYALIGCSWLDTLTCVKPIL